MYLENQILAVSGNDVVAMSAIMMNNWFEMVERGEIVPSEEVWRLSLAKDEMIRSEIERRTEKTGHTNKSSSFFPLD